MEVFRVRLEGEGGESEDCLQATLTPEFPTPSEGDPTKYSPLLVH